MKDKTHASVTVKDTNAAKESKQLLDIISEVKNVATALEHLRDNFAPMAAAMCLVGHIADDLDTYAMYERLLVLPKEDMLEDMFRIITNLPSDHELGQMEGCYLYFDTKKKKWIRSGKTGGDGEEA